MNQRPMMGQQISPLSPVDLPAQPQGGQQMDPLKLMQLAKLMGKWPPGQQGMPQNGMSLGPQVDSPLMPGGQNGGYYA